MIDVITDIKPRWNFGYANSPDIEITVNCDLHADFEWLYEKTPHDATEKFWLISTNVEPWVRFVWVDVPDGDARLHGALGGDYKLTDGTICKTRTGWSSRSGVYNRDHVTHPFNEVAECFVRFAERQVTFAGFYIEAAYLEAHDKFPRDCHLVRERKYQGLSEIYWTISTERGEVIKPDA
jgi:hypothetical protein